MSSVIYWKDTSSRKGDKRQTDTLSFLQHLYKNYFAQNSMFSLTLDKSEKKSSYSNVIEIYLNSALDPNSSNGLTFPILSEDIQYYHQLKFIITPASDHKVASP